MTSETSKIIKWVLLGVLGLGILGIFAFSGVDFAEGSKLLGLIGLGTGGGLLGGLTKRSRDSAGGGNDRTPGQRLDTVSGDLEGISTVVTDVSDGIGAVEIRVAGSVESSGAVADRIAANLAAGKYTIRDSSGNIIRSPDSPHPQPPALDPQEPQG